MNLSKYELKFLFKSTIYFDISSYKLTVVRNHFIAHNNDNELDFAPFFKNEYFSLNKKLYNS